MKLSKLPANLPIPEDAPVISISLFCKEKFAIIKINLSQVICIVFWSNCFAKSSFLICADNVPKRKIVSIGSTALGDKDILYLKKKYYYQKLLHYIRIIPTHSIL